jgi:beta-lactamase class A
MAQTPNRRTFIKATFAFGSSACGSDREVVRRPESPEVVAELARIEKQIGGRVGVFAFAPTVREAPVFGFREDERFAMCSTFKWALAAQLLLRCERGASSLFTELPFGGKDIQEYAPVARSEWGKGKRALSIEQWCEAAVTHSDNTAANLLLAHAGGPQAVTSFFRLVGDSLTQLDRAEPELNTNVPGDVRDTTTPRAMARALAAMLTTNVLKAPSRTKLVAWMVASPTGTDRLRAGFPPRLRAADKTGTGNNGACNDVAILWGVNGEPLVVAAYLSDSLAPLAELKQAHRRIGALVAQPFLRTVAAG